MKKKIKQILEEKGLTVSNQESEIIAHRLKYVDSLRKNIHKANLQEIPMALQYQAGDDEKNE